MTPDISFMKRLAPSMKRALLISGSALVIGFSVFFWGVLPQRTAIRKLTEETGTLGQEVARIQADISNTDHQKQATQEAKASCETLAHSGVIEPLLGSFAMRAKSLLDPIALQTSFHVDTVRELSPIPLQQPKPAPAQTHYRQPVEFTGQGSYAQITAFIQQTESAHPMAALSGLLILSQPQTPEKHKAIVTFEWPAKGEKSKPGTPPAEK